MPLWLIALLFLVGLAWIAFYFVSKISQALTRPMQSLIDSLESLLKPCSDESMRASLDAGLDARPTLGNQFIDLKEGIERLEGHLEEVERLLLPIAALAASRFEKIGWDRFLVLRKNMDKAISLSEDQKRQRKIMRDEHGAPVLVYEDEIEAARKRGWSLPD